MAKLYDCFNIKKYNNKSHDNCKYYKIIYKYLSTLFDQIIDNIHKNIKLLVDILKNIGINKLLNLIKQYNYECIKKIVYNDLVKLIEYGVPRYVLEFNKKNLLPIKYLYNKYNNYNQVNEFLNVVEHNINKITIHNIDKLFNMFIILLVNGVGWFDEWGPGNHGNKRDNIWKHYEKHVLNGNEQWDKYIDGFIGEKQYVDFAIDASKFMTNKCVHTDGLMVYFSGVFDKVLIIGRLDCENKLGISSCYIIDDNKYLDKISGIQRNVCFCL